MKNFRTTAMSNNSAANYVDPSRWDNTEDAVTTSYSLSIEKSSSDILAKFESADANAIVREIVLSRDRLGVEQGSMLAQKMSMLELDAIACLYQDPDLEENCRRRVFGRQPSQLDDAVQDQKTEQTTVNTINIPAIRVSADDVVSSTAIPGTHSDTDAINGQRAVRARSKSVGSPSSVPPPPITRKPPIKCPRSECKSHILYKTKRGLRQHLILIHELSANQARHDTELAFIAFHDHTSRITRPRHGPHEDCPVPAQTRVQGRQSSLTQNILAIGNQMTASAATDPTQYSMPLDTSIVTTWPQRSSFSSSWPHAAGQDHNIYQSELHPSMTSSLRQNHPTALQQVPNAVTTSNSVSVHRPQFWSNDVVLPPTRELRYSIATGDNALQQVGLQQYDPQPYNTWNYGMQHYDAQHNGTQHFGVQQRGLQQHDQQQDETASYFDQSTFHLDI